MANNGSSKAPQPEDLPPSIDAGPYFTISQPLPYVTHVEINRPEKLNAFIEEMWHSLSKIFTALSSSPQTRAIILSGHGPKAFTTGLDISQASQNPILSPTSFNPPSHSSSSEPHLDSARIAAHLRRHVAEFQACITTVEKCEKPVIAALHGWCFGLGIDISLCADVRICAANTKFAVKEVDIGLAADIGTLSRLPKVVGNGSWVKDVCLSARIFDAHEAMQQGLVSYVTAGKQGVMEKALSWAEMVAGKSPVAVQGTKEILNWSWGRSVEDGLRYTGVWNSVALQSRDVGEAMRATLKKRKGGFAKL